MKLIKEFVKFRTNFLDRQKKEKLIDQYIDLRNKTEIEMFLYKRFNEYLQFMSNAEKKVYADFRKKKIEKSELVTLNGFEIEIQKKESKGIINTIASLLGNSKKIDPDNEVFYINGNNLKLLEIEKIQDRQISIDFRKELYIYNKNNDYTPLRHNNKNIVWINSDTVITPEFQYRQDTANWVYDFKPSYFWNLANNVFDNNLTSPIKAQNEGLAGFLTPKKILIGIIIIGIVYYLQSGGAG